MKKILKQSSRTKLHFRTGSSLSLILSFLLTTTIPGFINDKSLLASATSCTELSINNAVASGYYVPNIPSNVIDHNFATRWSFDVVGSWIQLALKTPETVCHVDIAWYKGDQRSSNFAIALSKDGTTFTTAFSGWSSGKTTTLESYNFPEMASVRYVKITVYGTTTDHWASITEIRTFGYSFVSITSPPNYSNISPGVVRFSGTTSPDPNPITKVELAIDGNASSYKLATPKALGDWSTWSINYNVPTGIHKFIARATDSIKTQKSTTITLTGTISTSLTTGNSYYDKFDSQILNSAHKYGFPDPLVIKAQIYLESYFKLYATSSDTPCRLPNGWTASEGHSYGLLQTTPACNVNAFKAAGLLLSNGQPNLMQVTTSSLWSTSIFNPANNIGFGTWAMMHEYNNVISKFKGCTVQQYEKMALSSYNAGPWSVYGCGQYSSKGSTYVNKVATDYNKLAVLIGTSLRL